MFGLFCKNKLDYCFRGENLTLVCIVIKLNKIKKESSFFVKIIGPEEDSVPGSSNIFQPSERCRTLLFHGSSRQSYEKKGYSKFGGGVFFVSKIELENVT